MTVAIGFSESLLLSVGLLLAATVSGSGIFLGDTGGVSSSGIFLGDTDGGVDAVADFALRRADKKGAAPNNVGEIMSKSFNF